eukprot:c53859_g1_i1.p1 GENE.c53859_g1_i1~~c53859_g1_i1.p1  ORF type:complete len:177 (+),score=22.00 c53859_g1_i1:174-704(+)
MNPYYIEAIVGGIVILLILVALIYFTQKCNGRTNIVIVTHEEASDEFGYSEERVALRAKAARKAASRARKEKRRQRHARGGKASKSSKKSRKSKKDKLVARRAAAVRSKELAKRPSAFLRQYEEDSIDFTEALRFTGVQSSRDDSGDYTTETGPTDSSSLTEGLTEDSYDSVFRGV